MNEISNVGNSLDPQPRERCRTWPLKRPACCTKKPPNENNTFQTLEPALEEPSLTDELMSDGIFSLPTLPDIQDENQDGYIYSSLFPFTDIDNNGASEFSSQEQVTENTCSFSPILTPQEKMTIACDTLNNNFVKLETIPQESLLTTNYEFDSSLSGSLQNTAENNLKFMNSISTSPDKQMQMSASSSVSGINEASTSNNTSTSKPKSSSRKNPWGNFSYADLITQAIESSMEKRLTLAQIYDWMVKNIDFFKDKGDSNSSAGWKNSIRHNLSLHNKFKRVQNEGTGKSSWWIINYDAKPHKSRRSDPNRRRARSMETNNNKMIASREKASTKKKEWLKNGGLKRNSNEEGLGDWDKSQNSSVYSNFRNRTRSDVSSIGGRTSSNNSHLISELESDCSTSISPTRLSSSYTAPNGFDLMARSDDFDMTDNTDLTVNPEKLSERLENMDILPVSPPEPVQANDGASVFSNRSTSAQPHQQMKNNCNSSTIFANDAMSRPSTSFSQNQANQESASTIRFLLSDNTKPTVHQSSADLNISMARPNGLSNLQPSTKYKIPTNSSLKQNGEQLVQRSVLLNNVPSNQSLLNSAPINHTQVQYVQPNQVQFQQRNQQQHYQPHQIFVQQQNNGGNVYTLVQQVVSNNQQMGQGPDRTNMASNSEYLSDLDNLAKSEIFDPESSDITDPESSDITDLLEYINSQENADLYNMNSTADGSSMSSGFESSDFSTPQYPANPQSLMSGSRSSSSEQATQLENSTPIESCQSQIFTVLNAPLNGALQSNVTRFLGNETSGGNVSGFSNHFAHSHPVKIEQMSQGVGTEFHMR